MSDNKNETEKQEADKIYQQCSDVFKHYTENIISKFVDLPTDTILDYQNKMLLIIQQYLILAKKEEQVNMATFIYFIYYYCLHFMTSTIIQDRITNYQYIPPEVADLPEELEKIAILDESEKYIQKISKVSNMFHSFQKNGKTTEELREIFQKNIDEVSDSFIFHSRDRSLADAKQTLKAMIIEHNIDMQFFFRFDCDSSFIITLVEYYSCWGSARLQRYVNDFVGIINSCTEEQEKIRIDYLDYFLIFLVVQYAICRSQQQIKNNDFSINDSDKQFFYESIELMAVHPDAYQKALQPQMTKKYITESLFTCLWQEYAVFLLNQNRFNRCPNQHNSSFTQEQDCTIYSLERFMPEKSQQEIAIIVNQRCQTNYSAAQINQRYHRALKDNISQGRWNQKEIQQLIELNDILHGNIDEIKKVLGNRTNYQIRARLKQMKLLK